MKKLFLIFLVLLFITSAKAEVIRGSVSETKVPKGFYGSWHVTSKMIESNNASMFNPLSVDIWGLSGVGNILILTNEMTGAVSEIEVNEKNIQGLKLKFTRIKQEKENGFDVLYIETPEITLKGDIFEGFDTFVIEKSKNGILLNKYVVKYKVIGQKISGDSERNE
ncbi:MAG: hypothetical protein E7Z91_03665 [Cyanobacteria bacterium SIG30]|nr:hypothetical protein [Cyanobacteria bacterium SIG30]